MPSTALIWWRSTAATDLDEVEAAHAAVGGTGRGRRYVTGQLNNAYAVLLSSQFQRFCRDLHTEASVYLASLAPLAVSSKFLSSLTEGRKLDTGNPNPGNIGSDYDRLGLEFWRQPAWTRPANIRRRRALEQLNAWRNAIAHQDFTKPAMGGRSVVALAEVRRWRRACDGLAITFDRVLGNFLGATSGIRP